VIHKSIPLVVHTYLFSVLFSVMVNKPVGSAWCNWNEPAVFVCSMTWVEPRVGIMMGILAAELMNFLYVPTEKLQTPSSYSMDLAVKLCGCSFTWAKSSIQCLLYRTYKVAILPIYRHCSTGLFSQ